LFNSFGLGCDGKERKRKEKERKLWRKMAWKKVKEFDTE
jgi:hypothetical protein